MDAEKIVSIITVNYNNLENLKKSLKSLMSQTYPRIESIIVDGGSTDGSVDYIKQFAHEFAENGDRTCKWVSEPDEGLYYALNKGIEMATGDIVGCLWDEYCSVESLQKLVCQMESEDADGVHGDLVYVDENGKVVRDWKTGRGTIKGGWMPGHPTLLLKKEVYDKYGSYDTSYVSAADYEFMVRSLTDESVKIAYLPERVIRMAYGGLSTSSKKAYMRSILESHKALAKNKVRFPWLVIFKRILKTIGQF